MTVAGCNDHVTLAALSNKRLRADVYASGPASVLLYSDAMAGDCPPVDESDLSGTFGGAPLTFVSTTKAETPMTRGYYCFLTFETGSDIVPVDGVVRVSDH